MLASPMEILELKDGESVSLHVMSFQIDDAIIKPAHAPGGKVIRVMRLHVEKADKPLFPQYWDVTGAGAIAQLTPLLDGGLHRNRVVKITAFGEGAKKRHSVEVV